MLEALEPRLLQDDAARLTMNELATVADVSVSTLRQHLGSRGDVIAAVLERQGSRGAPYLASVAAEPEGGLEVSLRTTLQRMVSGLEHGLGDVLSNGLSLGLRDPTVGPAFLETMLEPILQSLEARLAWHQQKGELAPCDTRVAALSLVAPLVLGALHQRGLCGDRVRPLSLTALVDELVTRFVKAYAAPLG